MFPNQEGACAVNAPMWIGYACLFGRAQHLPIVHISLLNRVSGMVLFVGVLGD